MDNRAVGQSGVPTPVRTCVGCRDRAVKSNLLRVVAVGVGSQAELIPDPDGRLPGRGAYLHPSTGCLDLAQRRRVFSRALRHAGPLDDERVRRWIAEQTALPETR